MGSSSQVIIFKNIVFYSLKIDFDLANSVNPDKILYYMTFHLGLHCLPRYLVHKGINKCSKFLTD